jgi:hypothetical protein
VSEYRPLYDVSYALIVGIDTYTDPRFVTLGQAEADAQALSELLSRPPYDFRITQLLGAQASRQAILDTLFGLRRIEADDRVLIYFAGHGYTLIDRLGNETGYLAAADTVPEKDYTALALDDLIALTRHSPAKHIAFIFDACYSGQALGLTRAPAANTDKLLVRRAYQVMSAGAGDQTVSDYRSMTGVLINALESGVMNQDGMVTFSEVGLYLQQTITSESRMTQIPQFGHLRGSQGGEFVFYQDSSVRLPKDVVAMLASERAVARQGAAVALIEIARSDDPALVFLARQHLTRLSSEDPDPRVRSVATRYLMDTKDQQLEVDIHPAPRIRPPAAAPPAAPPPESVPVSEPPRYEPADLPGYQDSQPIRAVARKSAAKSGRRRSGFIQLWLLPVAGIAGLACVAAIAAIVLLYGLPGAGNSVRTQTAAATQTAISQNDVTPSEPAGAVSTAALTATPTQFVPSPTPFIPSATYSPPRATVAPPAPPTDFIPTEPPTVTVAPPPTAPPAMPTPTLVQ